MHEPRPSLKCVNDVPGFRWDVYGSYIRVGGEAAPSIHPVFLKHRLAASPPSAGARPLHARLIRSLLQRHSGHENVSPTYLKHYLKIGYASHGRPELVQTLTYIVEHTATVPWGWW